MQRDRTSLQSHIASQDQSELSTEEKPRPKNTLYDMNGDRFLYLTKSVLSTSYPSVYSHELPTRWATRLVSDRRCVLRSGQRDKSGVISSVEWPQTALLRERKQVMIEATTDQEKIGQALRWIVSLLTRYEIPYQICGGMAAKAYGATRPLVDIDFYAALQGSPHFQEFLKEIHPYLIREWSPHLSASWDIIYLALNYQGMQIEIGEATTKPRFYNHRDGRWEEQRIDFLASTPLHLYGVEVMVMPKDELLAYKAMLARSVDQLDSAQLTAAS